MLVLAAFGSIVLSVLLLSQGRNNLTNLLAAGINICVAIWSLAILVFMHATDPNVGLVSAKFYYIVTAIFAALLAIFATVFPRGDKPPHGLVWFASIAAALMSGLLLIPNFMTVSVITFGNSSNYIVVDHASYFLFCLYFIGFFSTGFIIMARKFGSYKHHIRSQAGSYLIGIIAMSLPGFVTNLYLPYFAVYDYIWIGPAMASIFVASVTYGIVKHGMFDVRLASVRTLAYILSLGTLAGLYILLASWLSGLFFPGQYNTNQQSINVVLALVLVFVFQPIKHFFDKLTKRIFYSDSYDTDTFYAHLNRLLTHTSDLRFLLERVSNEINTTLNGAHASLFVYVRGESRSNYVNAGTIDYQRVPIADIRTIDDYILTSGIEPIITEELDDANKSLRRLLISHRIAVALPLVKDKTVLGYFMLGERRSGSYKTRDIRLLATISDELIIAIENALAIQQIKELNANLQQRISEATSELRASNAQLRRLDEAKDEFVSMASHQLRTPLTSVKGYISMVIEGDVGKITPTQKHLLNEAFNSSERMVHLINDFLNVSRLQTGKFIIDSRPIDLAKVVQEELESLESNASTRNLKFKYKIPKKFPVMDLDEGKMRQVIMNFADNAIYYSKEGKTIEVSLSADGNRCRFMVKDKGIGVPVAERAQLFTKFYRATNARRQRPDGTGVGLFLAKKVINAHGGDVIFESEEGKGSTFGFSLPIKPVKNR